MEPAEGEAEPPGEVEAGAEPECGEDEAPVVGRVLEILPRAEIAH